MKLSSFISEWKNQAMFHGVESLRLQYKGTKGYLKAVEKEQIIEWMRTQIYLRLSDLQKFLKKQYDVVFDRLQSYYNLLKEAGITWKKTHSYKSS